MKFEDAIKSKQFQSENAKSQLNIIYTSGILECFYNTWFKRFDLTTYQYNVLRIVRGHANQGITVKDITQRLIYRNSNTTRIIDKLVDKDLIARRSGVKDRRAVHVILTQKGVELLSTIDQAMQVSTPHRKSLEESEAAILNMLLDKLRSGFEDDLGKMNCKD